MAETIHYERRGHVARVTLDNPERHNALGRAELEGLQAALAEVEQDDQVRVLVLTVPAAGSSTLTLTVTLEVGG